jgi:hypothetical protein
MFCLRTWSSTVHIQAMRSNSKYNICKISLKYQNASANVFHYFFKFQIESKAKDDTSEILILFKEILNANGVAKTTLKKINRFMPTSERKYLSLDKAMIDSIDVSIHNYYQLFKVFRELCQNLSLFSVFSTNESTTSSISIQKLDELLYQVYDKVYMNDDSGPLDSMR